MDNIQVEIKNFFIFMEKKFLEKYDYLIDVTAADFKENFMMYYHLSSYSDNNKLLVVKVNIPKDNPEIHSVCSLWSSADWMEREVFDMFGIMFLNHPNLKRILLPDDFIGHPMRKDYKI